ncbi:MAG: ABC transporter permease [Caldilineaceae bacterium]
MIVERIPNTLMLVGVAFAITLIVAIPLGAISARKRYFGARLHDHHLHLCRAVGADLLAGLDGDPGFLCVDRQSVHGSKPLLPSGGMYSLGGDKTLGDLLWHLVMPVGTLSLAWIAWYSRFFRASMLEVLNADYVRTARAKGLTNRRVIYVHALRNAVMPLVTMIALDIPSMFAGALFIETIFSWPGMGRLFWEAARGRDYPVLLGVILINAAVIVVANIVADLLYAMIDPRVQYE